MKNAFYLVDKLEEKHSLTLEEYAIIIEKSKEAAEYAIKKADKARKEIYGNEIYIRGLIEIGNICKNDCLYCGIRRGNKNCDRYRLTYDEIMNCCKTGYDSGFRTFVLQGGEDAYFDDGFLCEIISDIKKSFPGCAVTLSMGERGYKSFKRLFLHGADRYLLRHETADKAHYEMLHPEGMSFENRIKCLYDLKEIGYQTGCGFMVGSPYQTAENIASDLKFIEEFSPDMCGIGPFIPHRDTEFRDKKPGSIELTCFLISIIRLIKPNILLPATTALGTLSGGGREKGILSGANVLMPNISPMSARKKYELYNNKAFDGYESGEKLEALKNRIQSIGYNIVSGRGDIKTSDREELSDLKERGIL